MALSDRSPDYRKAYGDQLARAIRAEAALNRLEAHIRSREFAEAVELERAARGAGDDEYSISAMQDSVRKVLDARP